MILKTGLHHEKMHKCMFRPITAHITSNIIALHDKNLGRTVDIGILIMHTFEANWPEGFLDPITKQIVTFT